MHRRDFIRTGAFLGAAAALGVARRSVRGGTAAETPGPRRRVMTVDGWRPAAELGFTLPHEHVLVDFAGTENGGPERYVAEEVVSVVLPHLRRARELGCRTLVECTPAGLGRDPLLLKRLAARSGLAILTNTGLYAAAGGKFLPDYVRTDSADRLAERWIAEWRDGIGTTGIRPGFIKIGVDAGPLSEIGVRLLRAAARTHRKTGLPIAAHTVGGAAALEELVVLREEGIPADAWIWVHAQTEKDGAIHARVAGAGGWLEFDGLGPDTVESHLDLLIGMKRKGFLDRILVSHDAGWYSPGEPGGGAFRSYDTIFTGLLPALRSSGFTEREIRVLTVENPARAFAVRSV